jgi:hypothetical protein
MSRKTEKSGIVRYVWSLVAVLATVAAGFAAFFAGPATAAAAAAPPPAPAHPAVRPAQPPPGGAHGAADPGGPERPPAPAAPGDPGEQAGPDGPYDDGPGQDPYDDGPWEDFGGLLPGGVPGLPLGDIGGGPYDDGPQHPGAGQQPAHPQHPQHPQKPQGPQHPAQPPHPAAPAPVRLFHGLGFDTCHTPSLGTLRAWQASPYRAVGVYFGGRARGCPSQPLLTHAWTLAADRMGWSILPVYVGSQSPCVTNPKKRRFAVSAADATATGVAEAGDAVRRAAALGFAPNSPLYLDVEAYRTRSAKCTAPTLAYVRAWDHEVNRLGYLTGFYSSANSGIAQMASARAAGAADVPDVLWYARWGTKPTLTGEPALDERSWTGHRRIHQYTGDVEESHGGVALGIDRDMIDAPVAIVR